MLVCYALVPIAVSYVGMVVYSAPAIKLTGSGNDCLAIPVWMNLGDSEYKYFLRPGNIKIVSCPRVVPKMLYSRQKSAISADRQ